MNTEILSMSSHALEQSKAIDAKGSEHDYRIQELREVATTNDAITRVPVLEHGEAGDESAADESGLAGAA